MTDVHNKQTRSYNMSQIKGKSTKPEILVRKFLFANGFRYKLNEKKLPGKPDIFLPKYKTAIFINGCFWHGHENCEYFKIPSTRTDWWKEKIEKNVLNDDIKQSQLKGFGFKVIVVWECQIKNKSIYSTLIKDVKGERS
jgi:DNA mismatch endonuclease, patch repair protein